MRTRIDPGTGVSDWPVVTVFGRGTTLELPGEPVAPGLVIVPTHDHGRPRWSGGWSLVHTGSRLRVGPADLPLTYAREFAAVLADGLDWTRAADQVRRDRRFREHHFDTVADLGVARDFGTPLWWARPSWRLLPPPWLITQPDGEQWAVPTWRDVVDLADRADGGVWSPIADDATVTRADRPVWELVCAAPLCGAPDGPPVVLTDWDDEYGGDIPVRDTDRGRLVTEARDDRWGQGRWQQHDRHWLCPDCAHGHPRSRD